MRGKVAIGIKAGDRSLTIKYAEPGAVLGLAEAVNGGMHATTAVAATNVEVQFVPRNDILEIIRGDAPTAMELLQTLSEEVIQIYRIVQRNTATRTFVN
jgi:CRP-like cAMP-binding protein